MNTASGTQYPGLEPWMRAFRETMSAFQSQGAPAAAGFSGMSGMHGMTGMPDLSALFGQSAWSPGQNWGAGAPWAGTAPWVALAQMPSMMPGAMAGSAPGVGGMFSGMFDQLSTLAQGQWQQLAAQFATPATQTGAGIEQWRQLLEAMAPAMAAAAQTPAPLADVEKSWREALSTPQVGPMREHVERWQQAMLAQLDYQQAARAFSELLGKILSQAQRLFEQRLAARAQESSGEPLPSMRALFDEWIEAGEQAWAEHAGSDEFVAALGAYTNAQLRVRAAMADQINRLAESLGLPTRQEVEADHRRIAELQRELRRLRAQVEALHGADRPQRNPVSAASAKPASAEASPAVVPLHGAAAEVAPAATTDVSAAPAKKPRRAAATAAPVRKARTGKALKTAASAKAEKPEKATTPKPEKPRAKAATRAATKAVTKAATKARAARTGPASAASGNVLPIVSLPRAIGVAAPARKTEAAPRRRASK